MSEKRDINIHEEELSNTTYEELYADANYRNTIATVDAEGKRLWVYPKKPSGLHHRWRIVVTTILLGLLFGGPFIKINGQPFLLLNVIERKFVILGQAFWPQDFILLAITLIVFFVFIILFTVVFGRVWCGWLCPQTLFLEMVFRKIEYWIEGDAAAQKRLDSEPLTFQKLLKKTAKHTLFILISVLIAHTLMAYIIGIDQVKSIVSHSPTEHIAGFIGLVSFSAIFYGLFARFREQACIAVCPYGRLQGVLLSRESIVVAYDWIRGEPRGHLKKNAPMSRDQGDCIDCKMCVNVCPTGIDIRNGTQLECVNCTACIDACDEVMLKIGKPKGLIRYASIKSITEGVQKLFTPRVIGYSVVLLALMGLLSFMILTRSPVETTILKVPGTLYQREPGLITNLYNIEFVNKTFDPVDLELRIESPANAQVYQVDGTSIHIPAEGFRKGIYFIKIPEQDVVSARTVVTLGVYRKGEKLETIEAKFIGPVSIHKATQHN